MDDSGPLDLHALPLPLGFVDAFGPYSPYSRQLDRLVARFLASLGPVRAPVRVSVPAPVLDLLRRESSSPAAPVFVRGFPVDPTVMLTRLGAPEGTYDLVELSCDLRRGWGVLAPPSLGAAGVEVYVALRRDGVAPGRASSLAALLAP